MVMRDLAVDMVGDVGLRDTMRAGSSDPGHDGAEVTKEVTVVGGQSTAGEGELAGTIMGKKGIGMLQERDQHEPVVNPDEALVENLESRRWVAHTRNKEQDRCERPRRTQIY